MKQTKTSYWSVMSSLVVLIICVACSSKKIVERIELLERVYLFVYWEQLDAVVAAQVGGAPAEAAGQRTGLAASGHAQV